MSLRRRRGRRRGAQPSHFPIRSTKYTYYYITVNIKENEEVGCSVFADGGFDHAVRFVGGKKYFGGIVHAEGRKIYQVEMLVRQREMNLADVLEIFKDGPPHGIKGVLKRLTLVLGEGLQEHLPDAMPDRTEFHIFLRI